MSQFAMSPRPGRPRCGGGSAGTGDSAQPMLLVWLLGFLTVAPSAGAASGNVPWGPFPTAPGGFSAALWDLVLPHSKQTQSCSLSQRDGVAGGSPGLEEQDPELRDPAELNSSQFGTLRGFYGQQVAAFVCLSVLPCPPFLILVPSSLLRGSQNSPPRTVASPSFWGWEASSWGCCR